MNFPAGLFSDAWAYGACVPLALVLFWCVRTAPWWRLADSGQSNVWLGAIVILMLMWSMKAGVKPGQNLHLLGVVAFTLMFGRQLAILGLCAVLAAVTFNSDMGWQAYALNALVMGVFPSLLAFGFLRLVERWLPANFFIYVFIGAFLNAAMTTVATGLFASGLLAAAGIYAPAVLVEDYLPYFMLLGFAEAWLNGAAITLMAVYFPDWLATFDDRRYFWKR